MRERKKGSYPKRDGATYSCKEDKHRQSEMRSKNHGEVYRSVLYDRPDDPRKSEPPSRRRRQGLVSRNHDGNESAGIECQ